MLQACRQCRGHKPWRKEVGWTKEASRLVGAGRGGVGAAGLQDTSECMEGGKGTRAVHWREGGSGSCGQEQQKLPQSLCTSHLIYSPATCSTSAAEPRSSGSRPPTERMPAAAPPPAAPPPVCAGACSSWLRLSSTSPAAKLAA